MELHAGAAGLGDAAHPGKVSATSAAHAVDDCWGEAWKVLGSAAVKGTSAFVESTAVHGKHTRPTCMPGRHGTPRLQSNGTPHTRFATCHANGFVTKPCPKKVQGCSCLRGQFYEVTAVVWCCVRRLLTLRVDRQLLTFVTLLTFATLVMLATLLLFYFLTIHAHSPGPPPLNDHPVWTTRHQRVLTGLALALGCDAASDPGASGGWVHPGRYRWAHKLCGAVGNLSS
jgi:hypothetical protein